MGCLVVGASVVVVVEVVVSVASVVVVLDVVELANVVKLCVDETKVDEVEDANPFLCRARSTKLAKVTEELNEN